MEPAHKYLSALLLNVVTEPIFSVYLTSHLFVLLHFLIFFQFWLFIFADFKKIGCFNHG